VFNDAEQLLTNGTLSTAAGFIKKGPINSIPFLGFALTLSINAINSFTGNTELDKLAKTAIRLLTVFHKKNEYLYSIIAKIPPDVYSAYYSENTVDEEIVKSLSDAIKQLIKICESIKDEVKQNHFMTNVKYTFFSDPAQNNINQSMAQITSLFVAYHTRQTDLITKLVQVGHRRPNGSVYMLPKDTVYLTAEANNYFFDKNIPVQTNYMSTITRLSNALSSKMHSSWFSTPKPTPNLPSGAADSAEKPAISRSDSFASTASMTSIGSQPSSKGGKTRCKRQRGRRRQRKTRRR
jgi:hypothetical protein